MVGCDGKDCSSGEGWFHWSCVGLSAKQAADLPSFLCPTCKAAGAEVVVEEEVSKPPKTRTRLQTVSQDTMEELTALPLPALKDKLRAHGQLVGGSKKELVARIVQCMEFGCLPKCPECGGGRIKEGGDDGFRCPGYMEDDEFQHCSFTSDGSDLEFFAWDPARA
eukprot:gb/GEZN01015276.1/.p1 GENE.gb/GEZN01015276.1/~~gb/GEZN01015276.1/.p1  ORF type:complete len:165 (-),score=27.43 gb/GEZN01015276.1/:194-688(-)